MTGMEWLVMFVVSLAISYAAYLLAPKPKQPKHEAADLNAPTVSAGRPIPVVFGTMLIKSPNVLWFGDKQQYDYEVKA